MKNITITPAELPNILELAKTHQTKVNILSSTNAQILIEASTVFLILIGY